MTSPMLTDPSTPLFAELVADHICRVQSSANYDNAQAVFNSDVPERAVHISPTNMIIIFDQHYTCFA